MNEDQLIHSAIEARAKAYCPYSFYKVGAAVLTEKGIFQGCNVENASYGLTICAERNAVFHAVSQEARIIQAIAVVTENGGAPCGACRQVLQEFSRPNEEMIILTLSASGKIIIRTTLKNLLPEAFQLNREN